MCRFASKQLTLHVCNLIFTTSNLAITTEVQLKQYRKEDFLIQCTEKPSLVITIIIAKGETQWLVHLKCWGQANLHTIHAESFCLNKDLHNTAVLVKDCGSPKTRKHTNVLFRDPKTTLVIME